MNKLHIRSTFAVIGGKNIRNGNEHNQNSSRDGPSIRLLSINHCIDEDTAIEGVAGEQELLLLARPVEGTCPWIWAPGCLYNSYVFDGRLNSDKDISDHVGTLLN